MYINIMYIVGLLLSLFITMNVMGFTLIQSILIYLFIFIYTGIIAMVITVAYIESNVEIKQQRELEKIYIK